MVEQSIVRNAISLLSDRLRFQQELEALDRPDFIVATPEMIADIKSVLTGQLNRIESELAHIEITAPPKSGGPRRRS